ncbi:MAG TPA: glycosyl hydrolase family 28-related protein, partial [Pirellulaceae bacterium]|nr:glycosyl hydrolase family 28-related protein [Pirellulaceae bacterium]
MFVAVAPPSPPAGAQTAPEPNRAARTNVRQLGAVGDGQTDDTSAIQRAIESGVAYLPTGTFRITRTLEIDLGKLGFSAVVGDGTARLLMDGPGPAIRFRGTHGGTADPATVQDAVWARERNPLVDGIEIVGGHAEADGIEAIGTMQLTISRVAVRRARHAVRLVQRNRNALIANCHFYDNRGCGVFYDHVNLHQSNINGCHISYNRGGGVVVRGGDVRNIQISGCDIEGNMGVDQPPTANVLLDCSDGTVAEVAIAGCTIQHEANSPESANIRILGTGTVVRRGEPQKFNCGHVTIADN